MSWALSVASFNVLAQCYSTTQAFSSVDPKHLSWGHRFPLIQRSILDLNADVLCMQVQPNAFAQPQEVDKWREYQPFLSAHGYESVYKQRTGGKADACVIAFKRVRRKMSN